MKNRIDKTLVCNACKAYNSFVDTAGSRCCTKCGVMDKGYRVTKLSFLTSQQMSAGSLSFGENNTLGPSTSAMPGGMVTADGSKADTLALQRTFQRVQKIHDPYKSKRVEVMSKIEEICLKMRLSDYVTTRATQMAGKVVHRYCIKAETKFALKHRNNHIQAEMTNEARAEFKKADYEEIYRDPMISVDGIVAICISSACRSGGKSTLPLLLIANMISKYSNSAKHVESHHIAAFVKISNEYVPPSYDKMGSTYSSEKIYTESGRPSLKNRKRNMFYETLSNVIGDRFVNCGVIGGRNPLPFVAAAALLAELAYVQDMARDTLRKLNKKGSPDKPTEMFISRPTICKCCVFEDDPIMEYWSESDEYTYANERREVIIPIMFNDTMIRQISAKTMVESPPLIKAVVLMCEKWADVFEDVSQINHERTRKWIIGFDAEACLGGYKASLTKKRKRITTESKAHAKAHKHKSIKLKLRK
jgi:hypothetical protein